MKRTLLAAAFLSAASIPLPAHAIEVAILGEGDVDAIVGAIGPEATMTAGAVAGINAAAPAITEIFIRPQGAVETGTAMPVADLLGLDVLTEDGVLIGVVAGFAVATDGENLVLVDLLENWVATIALPDGRISPFDRIAVRSSAAARTDVGLAIDADDQEFRTDLANVGIGSAVAPAAAP